MTWVVADHEAPAGSTEITVRKGQQVEVLEVPTGQDMCLVRLHPSNASEHPVEGMVPLSVLKPPPQGLRGQRTHEGKSYWILCSPWSGDLHVMGWEMRIRSRNDVKLAEILAVNGRKFEDIEIFLNFLFISFL
jgi:hypothetical protein